MYALIFTNSW